MKHINQNTMYKNVRSHKFYVALLVGCVNDAKHFTCSYTSMSKNIVMN